MAKTLDSFRAAHDPSYLTFDRTVYARDIRSDCKRFIVVSAQNGTPIEPDMWGCLLTAGAELDAETLVIPLRYKNPTSQWSGSARNAEWWDAPTRPYLWNQRLPFNPNVTLLADIKTIPTASVPLSGFDAVSLDSSGIVGHTKLQLKSIATPHGKMAKILTTTGAVTKPNYTDSKVGAIGEFHHSYSAVLVELDDDGKRFYMRQLHYSKTARRIIDIDKAYYPNRVERAPRALALAGGDTHVEFADPQVLAAVRELVAATNPEWLIEHDLLDAYACNPHHLGNYLTLIAKMVSDRASIEAEAARSIAYLRGLRKAFPKTKIAVAGSNHNNFLDRAVAAFLRGGMSALPHISPTNAGFLARLAARQCEAVALGGSGAEYPDAYGMLLADAAIKGVRALSVDESFMLGGVECGMHGDHGPNGARGSVRNLARIGVKSITGHGHSPEIFEGHYRVGTRTRLRLEYTRGPSSWLNTDCLLNADGKRQLITYIDGKFRR